uniref:Protein takeout-like n=1 Tax=Diabrotica virgifera virgifera TaxID=50390 RepID=A0A6P7GFN8_DIAVI
MRWCLLILFISVGFASKLPDAIPRCSKSKPDFKECVQKSMEIGMRVLASGNKELGLLPIDPLFIKDMKISSQGSSVTLEQKYHNINVHGMTHTDIKAVKADFTDKCEYYIEVYSPALRMEGEYELNGKILVFPLNSKGKCNVTLVENNAVHAMQCERYQKNGKTYMKWTNYTIILNPTRMVYDFDNLFPANPQIENEIKKTLNDNNLAIFNEVKPSFERIFNIIYLNNGNKIMSKVPIEEMVLP